MSGVNIQVNVPIKDPMVNDDSVGTTSKLLCPDHPCNMPYNRRRVRLFNTSATGILGLCLVDKGADVESGVYASAIKIPPGGIYPAVIDCDHRLLVVSNVPGTTYNYLVDDI